MTLRYLSLFSGIEAATAAWAEMGWVCVGVAEIETFPCRVLAHHHQSVPNLGDVTKITEADIAALGRIDLVVFGSPCQDLSVAGKRKGLDGARSGLFFTAIDIVRIARSRGGCRFALWENVPGAFTSNQGGDFAVVVDALAGNAVGTTQVPDKKRWGNEGAALGPDAMVEWATLDAQWFGVAQRRRRVFAIADFGAWADRPPILLEPQSMRGDSPPVRGAQEDIAGTLEARAGGGGFPGSDGACSGHVVAEHGPVLAFGGNNTSGAIDVATALNASGSASGRLDFDSETFVAYMPARSFGADGGVDERYAPRDICDALHTRSGVGGNKSPVIAFSSNAQPDQTLIVRAGDVAPCLRAGNFRTNSNPKVEADMLVVCVTGDRTHALRADGFDASEDGTGRGTPIIAFNSNAQPDQMVFDPHVSASLTTSQYAAVAVQSSQSGVRLSDVHATLDSNNGSRRHNGVLTEWGVRRLLPVECERLQGFPDGHTDVPKAKDGPRYKSLGNSMAVPVMRHIGRQIDFAWRFF